METLTVNGVVYTARIVTLDDLSLDDLLTDGRMQNDVLLKAAVRLADGSEVDWTKVKIAHAMQLLPLAMAACGFDVVKPAADTDDVDMGNA